MFRQLIRRALTTRVIPSVAELVADTTHDAGSVLTVLQNRLLVELVTDDALFDKTASEKMKLYCGADPTAALLHLGNLLPLMVLLHFAIRGHGVVGLVGGATGAVGDPSGRTSERKAMEEATRTNNVARISNQMQSFFDRGLSYARSRQFPVSDPQIETRNNAEWWLGMGMLDFLARYGRHIRVLAMLARELVLARLKSAEGLGFNEFAYQVLQAYDFYHLNKEHGVNVQVGGNDQWGNITAGCDLILRLAPKPAYGITVPLLLTPLGEKFGKLAGNAVFIDPEFTTPYQLYQYFIQVPDEMVGQLLRLFTLLPIEAVEKVEQKHLEDPGVRVAQRVLAREVTDMLHGVGSGDEMAYLTLFLFPTPDHPFEDEVLADKLIGAFRRLGILRQLRFSDYEDINDVKLSTVLARVTGKLKREIKGMLGQGAVYMGLERNQLEDKEDIILFDPEQLIEGKLMLVRLGKNNYYVVEWTD